MKLAAVLFFGFSISSGWAFAQNSNIYIAAEPPPAGVSETSGDKVQVILQKDHHWNVNAGPAVGVGMETNNIMYSVSGGYDWDFHPRISGKINGEVAMGAGQDSARLIDLNVGPTVYLTEASPDSARPYATADIGFASARNNSSVVNQGLTVGAGVGYQFASSENYRLNALLHGTVMTTTVGSGNPTVFAARIGVDL
jgi:hypothetical protein